MASATTKIVIRATDLASKPIRGVGGAIASLGRTVGRMRFMLLGLGTALGGFGLAKEFIEANSELEQMRMRIGSLLGDMKAGNQAIEWVRAFQKENPVRSIQEMTKSFEDFVAAGINPTTGAMKSLLAGSLKFGLTADDVKGVTRAFRQLTGVTNAQKEEINQIAERIPGTMAMLAKQLGRSQDVIRKQMKQGLVSSQEVAKAILRGLGENADETIKQFGNTWQSVMIRMKSAWFDFLTRVGESGLFDKMKQKIDEFTSFINNNMDKLVDVTSKMAEFIGRLAEVILNTSTGVEFKLKPMLVLVTKIVTNVASLFVIIKTALTASLAVAANISNTMTNLAGRAEAVGAGFLIPTASKVEESIKSLSRLRALYTSMQRDQSGHSALDIMNTESKVLLEGGLEGINEKIKNYREILKKLKSDINDWPVDVDLKGMFTGMEDGINRVVAAGEDMVTTINGLKDPDPNTSGDGQKSAFDDLKKSLEQLDIQTVGTKDNMTDAAKEVEDSWATSLEKIQEEFREKFGTMEKIGARFTEGLNDALDRNFSRFFDQLIEGHIPRLRDAIASFLKDILRMMTDMMSQKLAMQVTQSLIGAFVGQRTGGGVDNSPGGVNGAGIDPNTGFVRNKLSSGVGVRGKGGAPMNMKVEVVNQSNELIQATETRSRQEFGQQIMTVVLDSVRTNRGGSRDALKAGLA